MNRFASIKTRITVWYTALMFVLISVVLLLVGTLSYRISIDNIENDVKLQVTQIAEKVGFRIRKDTYFSVENSEEFKNVSIYKENGEFVVGQYNYDLSAVPFKNELRRENVGGEAYIVFDEFKPMGPGDSRGHWIRGAESINYTRVLGRYVILILLGIIPVILILTAAGGYYITGKAFLPINDIVKTANEISAQKDITRRIKVSGGSERDEIRNLSLTLNRMLDKIENLIRQEKQFTSDASHELRTPISVILAQGEYLLDITEKEKEKELAENIVDKTKQISKLVSRLLLLARIDSDRQTFNKEKVDVGLLADIASDSVKLLSERKKISVEVNVPDDIFVDADESLLLSAITNLISNGIKYGKENGHVDITASKTDFGTEIVITDDGIGISHDQLGKIWTRFYRVDDTRNDEFGSSGLGLSMVKSIVELHGGEISVKSEPDKGTEFKILLK